jgi:hypothetical protein
MGTQDWNATILTDSVTVRQVVEDELVPSAKTSIGVIQ